MLTSASQSFPKALANWRRARKLTQAAVAKASKEHRLGVKYGFSIGSVRTWEKGDTSPPILQFFETVMAAYEIYDIDVFLDYCLFLDENCETNRPKEIKDGSRDTVHQKGISSEDDEEAVIKVATLDQTKHHRIRIDEIEYPPGYRSDLKPHPGHEFILVLDGELNVYIREKGKRKPTVWNLSKGDSLAFLSFLPHHVENESGKKVRLVVGRSSWSKRGGESGIPTDLSAR